MARTGIQQKRRRYVHKQEQNMGSVYGGGNDGANKGKSYTHSNSPLSKSSMDNLQGEGKERRGRKHTGTTHTKSRTTGQKARQSGANKRNKAKRGGN